jgi:Zn-dependent oligopeptidase
MNRITLEKDAGLRFPAEEGFYGIIVSERPPMHVWGDKIYTLEVYDKNDKYVGKWSGKHGDF